MRRAVEPVFIPSKGFKAQIEALREIALPSEVTLICRNALDGLLTTFEAIAAPRSSYAHVWLWAFTLPQAFLEFVSEHEPFALVLLAHYATLVRCFEHDHWYIQGWSARVLVAVQGALLESWKPWLEWPVQCIQRGLDVLTKPENEKWRWISAIAINPNKLLPQPSPGASYTLSPQGGSTAPAIEFMTVFAASAESANIPLAVRFEQKAWIRFTEILPMPLASSLCITNSRHVNIINGCLMIFNWITAVPSAFASGCLRRRTQFLVPVVGMLAVFSSQTLCAGLYREHGITGAGYGVLAMLFFFYFFFNFAFNALLYSYHVEDLLYSIRAKGFSVLISSPKPGYSFCYPCYIQELRALVAIAYNIKETSQDVVVSFGEGAVKKLQDASAKYNPKGVFQTLRLSGFKIPERGSSGGYWRFGRNSVW
ncbi:hypothetical protein FOMG_19018 [Fusarium oxysporum f. sp. melonis 26406]|uniref:Uncharacterized protein n=1 Tax=Fusarium oxysporum f. sp. melonis 26406 TaxID=1089452 RepID=W9ZT21_FUSOX|nr:hypothetical protein FOMG_19018 [Fusarium oxysporum f. sp. melonis 26406]